MTAEVDASHAGNALRRFFDAQRTVSSLEIELVRRPRPLEEETLQRRDQVLLARAVVRNEMGIMTMSAIAVVTLALRAFATGG